MSGCTLEGLSLVAKNMPKMINFYSNTLGMAFKPTSYGRHKVYEGSLDGIKITVLPQAMFEGFRTTGNPVQIAFIVPNVDQAVKRGVEAGGTQLQSVSEDEGVRYCSLHDPDSNSIELVERGA